MSDTDIEILQAEHATLLQRIAELEQMEEQNQHLSEQLAESRATIEQLTKREQQLEQQALHYQNRFDHYFNAVPIGMASLSNSLEWLESNAMLCTMLGYSSDELMQMPWQKITYPEDQDPEQTYFDQLRCGEIETFSFDKRFIHKDHRIIYANIMVQRVSQPDDANSYFIVLIQDITERKRSEEDLQIFQVLMEKAPDGIVVTMMDGTIIYHNASYGAMHGYDNAVGLCNMDVVAEDDHALISEISQKMQTHGSWQGTLNGRRKDGSIFPVMISLFLILDNAGVPKLIAAIVNDMTEQQRLEAEQAFLQEQIIQTQENAIRELSSPLIPIADKVVIMPLIGSIDSVRALQIMETLLDGVHRHNAEIALVDMTGMQVVDSQVADALIKAAQSVQLLGAEVVVTGIGPATAQTLVHLGVDLSSIVSRSTLQDGIAYTLRRMRKVAL